MTRKRRRPENVTSFIDRHGKERWRFRKKGYPSHCFVSPFGSEEFDKELAKCRAAAPTEAAAERARPGTINDLLPRYYKSADFNSGGQGDQHRRRLILESFRGEFGNERVADFGFDHIEAILLTKSAKRQAGKRIVGGMVAARSLRAQLRRLFAHARRLKWIEANPAEEASAIKGRKTTGYHSWTEDEIARFQAKHAIGTRPRLALEIMLWTWQRRSDARLFGPEHLKRGKINYAQGKTGKDLWLPAAPPLLAAIAAMPVRGFKTFLVTSAGKTYSRAGFGNAMRRWCDDAGLPQCTAHGLRKAGARRAAQLGIGNPGLKAVGGWSRDDEVATYTAAVDQEALAEATLARVMANYGSSELANLPQETDNE